MNDDLSETLRGTLKSAARRAPDPRPDLLDRVTRRHRARRRRQAAAMAAAVLVIVGGSAVFSSALDDGDGARPAAPGPLPTVTFPTSVPVDELWPHAVRTIPNKLSNGRSFRPITLVDDDTLLIGTESAFEAVDQLLTYDLRTGRTKKIAQTTTSSGTTGFPSGFAVGDGQVAWWLARRPGDDGPTPGELIAEIWAAPLTGGPARKVISTEHVEDDGDEGLSPLTIADGKVVWSVSSQSRNASTGVFEAPLAGGGAARKIPGTDGYRLLAWPWADPSAQGQNPRQTGQVTHRTLRDLRTGRTRTANVRKISGSWTCGVVWCLGRDPDLTGYVQRRDGTGGRTISRRDAGGLWSPPIHDRFVVGEFGPGGGSRPTAPKLYDLATGKIASLGISAGDADVLSYLMPYDTADRLYVIRKKDSFTLIDLARIS